MSKPFLLLKIHSLPLAVKQPTGSTTKYQGSSEEAAPLVSKALAQLL